MSIKSGERKLITANSLRKIIEGVLNDWECGRKNNGNHPVDTMKTVYKGMLSQFEMLPDAEVLILGADSFYNKTLKQHRDSPCETATKEALAEAEKLKRESIEEEG